jgi:carbamoyl-phosphate synthase large subunit
MKKILLTGCGGAPTLSYVRSLRDADPRKEKFFLVGVDADKYTIHRSECDKTYICPFVKDEKYISFILEIIKKEKIDFLHTQPEPEVYMIGKNRNIIEQTGCKLLMPKQETIEILRDKYKSYQAWLAQGITVPRNIKIDNEQDLLNAFKEFNGDLWIRETIGAAGKGALSKPSYELAKAWINYRNGWGITVAAEHLTQKTTTWQSLWYKGKLVVGQGRSRLYWEMSNRTQSGVTGLTGTGKIDNNPNVTELAIKCINAVDESPNGIFSVDFTYDKNGTPNPTEINIGKFFTTHHFITTAGCNMPEIMVQLAFDEYQGKFDIINPCKEDYYWIRGMDVKPVFVTGDELKNKEMEYNEILTNLEL